MLPTCTPILSVQNGNSDETHLEHLASKPQASTGFAQERIRNMQTEAAKGVPASSNLTQATTPNAQVEVGLASIEYLMPGEYLCGKCGNWVEVHLPVLSTSCQPCKASLAFMDLGPLFLQPAEEA